MNTRCKIGVILISICIVIRTVQVKKADKKESDEIAKKRETLKQRLGQLKEANRIYYEFFQNLKENIYIRSEIVYTSTFGYYDPEYYVGHYDQGNAENAHKKENNDFKKQILDSVERVLEEFDTNTDEDDEEASVNITKTEDVDLLQQAVDVLEGAFSSYEMSAHSLRRDLERYLNVAEKGKEIYTCSCQIDQYTFVDEEHVRWFKDEIDEIDDIEVKIKELTHSNDGGESFEDYRNTYT